MHLDIQHIIYLLSSVTFILGLKMLSNAKTAKKGNSLAAVGMIAAILTAIVFHDGAVSPLVYGLIFGAIAIEKNNIDPRTKEGIIFISNSMFYSKRYL